MKRLLVRSLLFLCMLLVGGYSELRANAHASHHHCSKWAYASACTGDHTLPATVRSASSGSQREDFNLEALLLVYEDDDDDKLISFKKYPEDVSYSFSAFFAPTSGTLFSGNDERLSFNQPLLPVPAGRYLLLQVFRI